MLLARVFLAVMRSWWKCVGVVLLSFGMFAALTACAAVAPPRPSAPLTPSAAASTPPQAPAAPPIVDTIIVRPTGIDLVAAGTTRNTLPYTEPADTFTSQLAAVLGAPATETFHASRDYRQADSTTYEWPGLMIADSHLKVGGPGPSPQGPPTLSLVAIDPVVGNGIEVRTVQGIRPGDSVVSVATTLGVDPAASEFFSVPAETGPKLGPSHMAGQVNADAVAVSQTSANPSVVNISGPYNFGDGHDI
jgi:hypothetical protein